MTILMGLYTNKAYAIAPGLGHFARERTSQLADSGPLRVELLTIGQAIINVFPSAAILHDSSAL